MKAGTAQKLVLGVITTAVMARLGRVPGGRMTDVSSPMRSSAAAQDVSWPTWCVAPPDAAAALLDAADQDLRTAEPMGL